MCLLRRSHCVQGRSRAGQRAADGSNEPPCARLSILFVCGTRKLCSTERQPAGCHYFLLLNSKMEPLVSSGRGGAGNIRGRSKTRRDDVDLEDNEPAERLVSVGRGGRANVSTAGQERARSASNKRPLSLQPEDEHDLVPVFSVGRGGAGNMTYKGTSSSGAGHGLGVACSHNSGAAAAAGGTASDSTAQRRAWWQKLLCL